MAQRADEVIRSDSAVLCVSIYGIWRPIRLMLTGEQLICRQGLKTVSSVLLSTVQCVEVVEAKVMLGVKRKVLLVEAGRIRRLICVKEPETWRDHILQLRNIQLQPTSNLSS